MEGPVLGTPNPELTEGLHPHSQDLHPTSPPRLPPPAGSFQGSRTMALVQVPSPVLGSPQAEQPWPPAPQGWHEAPGDTSVWGGQRQGVQLARPVSMVSPEKPNETMCGQGVKNQKSLPFVVTSLLQGTSNSCLYHPRGPRDPGTPLAIGPEPGGLLPRGDLRKGPLSWTPTFLSAHLNKMLRVSLERKPGSMCLPVSIVPSSKSLCCAPV